MSVRILAYKRTTWLNKETNEAMYGVKVRVERRGWMDVADDGRAVILYDPKDADKYMAAMKAERTKDGWRKACALASAESK